MEQPKETSTGAAKKRKSKACLWLNRPKKKSKIENAIVTPLQSKDANERPKSIELRKAPLKTRGNRRKIRRKLYNAHADDQIPQIYPRNHTFDSPSRLNKKQRKSKRSDVSKPNAVSRGCLPIRQHHKCDESKVLPTTRLGIELQD